MSNKFRHKGFLTPGVLGLVLLFSVFSLFSYAAPADKAAELDKLFKGCAHHDLFNGAVLVAENGKVIYQSSNGPANTDWDIPNTPDTKFQIYSMTKQFVAMVTLQLVQEGKLKLDGKVSDYLPYYRKDTGGKVTLHHLMTHTHGIPEIKYETLPLINELSNREMVEKYLMGDLQFEPGSRFNYSIGFHLLAAVIREVTGESLETNLKKRIWAPLGMKDTGHNPYTKKVKHLAVAYEENPDTKRLAFLAHEINGGSGMYSTAADLFKWDRALYTSKLLKDELREKMFTGHIEARGGFYAYGWEIRKLKFGNLEKTIAGHGGGGSTMIYRNLDDGHTVIFLSNVINVQAFEISTEAMKILYGLPYNIPKKVLMFPLIGKFREKGVKGAIGYYRKLYKEQREKYLFNEDQLNRFGYYVLQQGNVDDAIAVFLLNVEMYPQWWNAHDSLAETYLKKGDREKALGHYQKAFKLNPNSNDWEKRAYKVQQENIKNLKNLINK